MALDNTDCGQSILRCFGRYAFLINARRVKAIGDTWIRYGNQTYRRDRPGRPVGVPVWECGR